MTIVIPNHTAGLNIFLSQKMDEYFRSKLDHEAILPWGVKASKVTKKLTGFTHAHRLLSALNYLHSNQIVHRNITPTAIVWWQDKIYLTGFNDANFVYAVAQTTAPMEASNFPDPGSRQPLPQHYTQYSNPAPGYQGDLWALGCTLWELYSGEPAFPPDVNEKSSELYDVDIRADDKLPPYLRPLVKRLLERYVPPVEYGNLHEWLDDNLPGKAPMATQAVLKTYFVGFPLLRYSNPSLSYLYPLTLDIDYLQRRKKMLEDLWRNSDVNPKTIGRLIQQGQQLDAKMAGLNTPNTVSLFYSNPALQQAPKEMLALFKIPTWTTLDETTANQKVVDYLQIQGLLYEPSTIV